MNDHPECRIVRSDKAINANNASLTRLFIMKKLKRIILSIWYSILYDKMYQCLSRGEHSKALKIARRMAAIGVSDLKLKLHLSRLIRIVEYDKSEAFANLIEAGRLLKNSEFAETEKLYLAGWMAGQARLLDCYDREEYKEYKNFEQIIEPDAVSKLVKSEFPF